MKINLLLAILAVTFAVGGCSVGENKVSNANAAPSVSTPMPTAPVVQTTPPPSDAARGATVMPVTLPVLDAMFADDAFTNEVKSKLQLTDEQIRNLRDVARQGTSSLRESNAGHDTTTDAMKRATEKISAVIGADKTTQLAALVRDRWQGGQNGTVATAQTPNSNAATNTAANANVANANSAANANTASPSKSDVSKPSAAANPNGVPNDSRIVVNAPAYRMDVFDGGRLVKSYKVGIGYPEFPLPTGMRQATTIVFNPTWTPPDEPWVEGSNKVKAGEKVEAGSPLNPLGPIKIPIGAPSLIHGGKSPAKLGGFASHGCVGLTSPQVQRFARQLAGISRTNLTDADVSSYAKNRTQTKNVKLASPVPVELRYDTIVVQDGNLHIYRDVYGYGTNTEQNLRAALQNYGVSLEQLSDKERAQVLSALQQMARDAKGKAVNTPRKRGSKSKNAAVTRGIAGQKEAVIQIAALAGKGYPAPVNLDTGGGQGQKTPKKRTRKKQ